MSKENEIDKTNVTNKPEEKKVNKYVQSMRDDMTNSFGKLTPSQEAEFREILESRNQGKFYDSYMDKLLKVIPSCSSRKGLGIYWLETYLKRVKMKDMNFVYLMWDTMDFEELGRRLTKGEYVLWDSEYIILEKSRVALEFHTW